MKELERAKSIVEALVEQYRPASLFGMAVRIARLPKEDLAELDKVEEALGEEGANKWMCQVMEETGEYHWDHNDDTVERRYKEV